MRQKFFNLHTMGIKGLAFAYKSLITQLYILKIPSMIIPVVPCHAETRF